MSEEAPAAVGHMLPDRLSRAAVELSSYWVDSFGNATRIDYGTGEIHPVLPYCPVASLDLYGFSNINRKIFENALIGDGAL